MSGRHFLFGGDSFGLPQPVAPPRPIRSGESPWITSSFKQLAGGVDQQVVVGFQDRSGHLVLGIDDAPDLLVDIVLAVSSLYWPPRFTHCTQKKSAAFVGNSTPVPIARSCHTP
jgi:hypothetical protein